MEFVSVRDLRNKSGEIWKRIKTEKDMVITSNGRPIALLFQLSAGSLEETLSAVRKARAIEAVQALQSQSVRTGKDRLTLEEINTTISTVRKHRAK